MKNPPSRWQARSRIFAVLLLLAIQTSARPALHRPPRPSGTPPKLGGELKQKQEQDLPSSNEEGWRVSAGVVRGATFSAGVVVRHVAVASQAAPANKSAITVDESKMRFDFEPQVQFVLPLINKTPKQFHAKVELQFLDNEDKVAASGVTAVVLDPGNFLNNLALGKKSPITDSPSLLGTYRLKYRVLPDVPTEFAPLEGIVQVSKIITNPYQVRISTAKTPHPGTRFPVRVRVEHPYDGHSYPGMDVTATLKLKPQDSDHPAPLPVPLLILTR